MREGRTIARGGLSMRAVAFRTGGVMVAVVVLLGFLGPWRGTTLDRAKDLVGASRHRPLDLDEEQVASVAAGGRSQPVPFPLQGAENVVDRFANTAWATRWLDPTGPGFETIPEEEGCQPAPMTDSFLRVTFAEPTDLQRIRILAGRAENDPGRTRFLRPRVVELRADDGECSFIELADVGELTVHRFEHDDVSVVELRIVGVYEPEDEASETVEISEIVFDR
jgi:hypothetical protein